LDLQALQSGTLTKILCTKAREEEEQGCDFQELEKVAEEEEEEEAGCDFPALKKVEEEEEEEHAAAAWGRSSSSSRLQELFTSTSSFSQTPRS
jgi:hypothetical protein